MMASAQVVEASINTNNSPSQDYTTNPDDHSNRNIKTTFQPFLKFLKIFENCQKSSEIFESLRKNRKMSESSQNDLRTLFENFRKFSEIFGSARKPSEISHVIGGLWKLFILFQSDTCRLKIRFKNFDL